MLFDKMVWKLSKQMFWMFGLATHELIYLIFFGISENN